MMAGMQAQFFDIVVLMALENTGWSAVQGCAFFDHFTKNGTVFTNWTGAAHPSGPNYRAMLSGRTWSGNEFDGVNRPNLGDRIDYRVIAFRGEPAQRHNPFLDMNPGDPRAAAMLGPDGFHDGALAALIYLGLDDGNNAHSAALSIADANAMAAVAAFDALTIKLRKLFILTFDEAFGPEYDSNHVFTGMIGTGVPVKAVNSRVSHIHLAQFLADNFGQSLFDIDPAGRSYAGRSLIDLP